MRMILFRGKYVKPLIELLNKDGRYILFIDFLNGNKDLFFRNTIPMLGDIKVKQIVITKKDYERLLVLLSITNNPLEVFESIYYKE